MGQYHVMLAKRRGARVIMSEVDENAVLGPEAGSRHYFQPHGEGSC